MNKLSIAILSGATGAILALLFAPRSGEEARACLADKIDAFFQGGEGAEEEEFVVVSAEGEAVIPEPSDEIRAKIEAARARIAEQVNKNAAAATEAVKAKAPLAASKVTEVASVAVDKVGDVLEAAADKVSAVASSVTDKVIDRHDDSMDIDADESELVVEDVEEVAQNEEAPAVDEDVKEDE